MIRPILVLVILTNLSIAGARLRSRGAYETFRAARAECKKGGPHLDAIVARSWDPAWARTLVKYQAATDEQRAEFDQLADQVLGGYERRTAISLICDYRVTARRNVDDDDDGKPPRYELVVRDDKCARYYAPDQPCFCVHKLVLEKVADDWFYVGDSKLCGVPLTWQHYRQILKLPGGYARYGAEVDIEVAIKQLRDAHT